MDTDTLIILGTALLLLCATTLPYVYRYRRQEAANRDRMARASAAGLNEPPTLHPVVDPDLCVGSAACVAACPQGQIIGLIDGRAALLNASRCVGHGQCAAACPVAAISLVFGTARRGIDIPYLSAGFETNVPGMYIVGELGGMGLIRNAVRQGREAVEGIARQLAHEPRPPDPQLYDVLVAGAGPAGMAASLTAMRHGLKCRTVEQEAPGGAVRHYPRQKLVMTEPMELPLYGRVPLRRATKEELLAVWADVLARTGLQVHTDERLVAVERQQDTFRVETTEGTFAARRVVLAIGRRGTPRRLGVPGEESEKVAYQLLDPDEVRDSRVLVVGGGNSALETACALANPVLGNAVNLAYRGEGFFRAGDEVRQRLEALAEQGRIDVLLHAEVTAIAADEVALHVGGQERTLANDQVFACLGGDAPIAFLQRLGVTVERRFGEA